MNFLLEFLWINPQWDVKKSCQRASQFSQPRLFLKVVCNFHFRVGINSYHTQGILQTEKANGWNNHERRICAKQPGCIRLTPQGCGMSEESEAGKDSCCKAFCSLPLEGEGVDVMLQGPAARSSMWHSKTPSPRGMEPTQTRERFQRPLIFLNIRVQSLELSLFPGPK